MLPPKLFPPFNVGFPLNLSNNLPLSILKQKILIYRSLERIVELQVNNVNFMVNCKF